jgi:hypothetical protein
MVIPSVRKQQNSSKAAAVYIDSPRLRLLCGEVVVVTDAMVEQATRHQISHLKQSRCHLLVIVVCLLNKSVGGNMIVPPGFVLT